MATFDEHIEFYNYVELFLAAGESKPYKTDEARNFDFHQNTLALKERFCRQSFFVKLTVLQL